MLEFLDGYNVQENHLSELEILSKTGLLSIVSLSNIQHGATKEMISLPQQPTNNLMFYYVHSLMAVTRVLINLHSKKVYENIATENLMYLCKDVFTMRESGLWNNP